MRTVAATAEVMAATQLLGYNSTPVDPLDAVPLPPQGADLTLGIVRAMKGLGFEQKLLDSGAIDVPVIKAMKEEAKAEADAAVVEAMKEPEPTREDVEKFTYAPSDVDAVYPKDYTGLPGKRAAHRNSPFLRRTANPASEISPMMTASRTAAAAPRLYSPLPIAVLYT